MCSNYDKTYQAIETIYDHCEHTSCMKCIFNNYYNNNWVIHDCMLNYEPYDFKPFLQYTDKLIQCNKWINVKEKLPPLNIEGVYSDNVLIIVHYENENNDVIYIGFLVDSYQRGLEWYTQNMGPTESETEHVTYWMPLPKIPRRYISNPSNEEVIKAIKALKDKCAENNCEDCILYRKEYGECWMRHGPNSWELPESIQS